MEEIIKILHEFGVMGLWGIILYKILDFIEIVGILLVIGYGFKKLWPYIIKD